MGPSFFVWHRVTKFSWPALSRGGGGARVQRQALQKVLNDRAMQEQYIDELIKYLQRYK
jgi:hypothetical protein